MSKLDRHITAGCEPVTMAVIKVTAGRSPTAMDVLAVADINIGAG